LGSPRDGSLFVSPETRARMSEGLKRYYAAHTSKALGTKVSKRSDDTPVFLSGFWFPSRRACIQALRLSASTYHRRLKLQIKNKRKVF